MGLLAGGTPEATTGSATYETSLNGTAVRYPVLRPRVACTVWLTETGQSDSVTGLRDAAGAGLAGDQFVSDDLGRIPVIQLPEGLTVDGVWVDPQDPSTARFYLPVRIGPASVAATTVARPAAGTPAGMVPTVQPDGSMAYQTPPGSGSSAVTAVDF